MCVSRFVFGLLLFIFVSSLIIGCVLCLFLVVCLLLMNVRLFVFGVFVVCLLMLLSDCLIVCFDDLVFVGVLLFVYVWFLVCL